MLKFILPILFILFFTFQSNAQTTINANSSVFGKWKKANSPYIIKGNISVPRDSTLTIESGVQVRFDGKYLLSVYGNIKAIGKVADTIRFYPLDTNNRWRGIRYWGRNQTKDSATFSYCKFMYAEPTRSVFEHVLRMSQGNFYLNNCMFTKNKGNEYATCLVVDSALSFVMDKCYFYLNSNINTNPNKTSYGIEGPVLITSGKISNCKFEKNTVRNPYNSLDNYQVDGFGSGGIIGVSDYNFPNTRIDIENCEFIGNVCALKGAGIDISGFTNNGKIYIKNCKFTNNHTGRYGCISYFASNTQAKKNRKIIIDQCEFKNNISANSALGDGVSAIAISNFNSNDSVVIKNSLFESNIARSTVKISSSTQKNNYIIGNVFRGNAIWCISNETTTEIVSINNIFHNNLSTNVCNYINANFTLKSINDAYLFNGPNIDTTALNTKLKNHYQNQFYKLDGSYVSEGVGTIFRNCIFWQNKNWKGKLTHLSIDRDKIAEFSNCIIDGNIDSTIIWTNEFGAPRPNPIITLQQNTITSNPLFVNPPSAYGQNGLISNVDFRLKNDCQVVSPAFNKGFNNALSSWVNLLDKDGNSRLACDTVDIGPYEIQGRKNAIAVRSQSKDTSICAKESLLLSAQASCAPNTAWQWQINQNNTWQNHSQTMPLSYQANQNAQFRAIVTSTDCQVKDTSNIINITAKPLPMPNLGNDTIILHNQNLTLNPGNFTTYQWNTGASTPTLNINGRTEPLGIKTIFVKVTNQEGCSASDTIKITINFNTANSLVQLMQVKIYPNPTLGQLNIDNPQQKDINFQLMGTDGKVWLSGNNNQNFQLDLSNFPKQVYILSLTAEGQTQHLKIIRQ